MSIPRAAPLVALVIACAPPRLLPLRAQSVAEGGSFDHDLFHVEADVEDAADPLPVRGEGFAFEGVVKTLGRVIALAARDWARRHAAQRPGGWDLEIDLIQSRAEESQGRISVELATRVTLSGTLGHIYLAQTHGYCRQVADPGTRDPTLPVYACMDAMAHDLTGWLEGVSP